MPEKRNAQAAARKAAYDLEHKRATYHRIPLDVRKEDYPKIKEAAIAQGETVNGWIKRAISERLERDAAG